MVTAQGGPNPELTQDGGPVGVPSADALGVAFQMFGAYAVSSAFLLLERVSTPPRVQS
jgi:hypothetical protein